MDFKTFLENFDVIAEAPGGIPKLRLLILDLAVRGKLVAQNSEDEAASVLSNKSKFQREQWIEAGKIRKSKQLPPISQEEIPYQPPQGWEWCRFSNVVFFQEGPGIRNWQFRATGIKLLNVKNIVQGKLVLENSDKYIDEEEFTQKYRHFLIEEGDLLFASSGNSWGKTAFFKDPGYRVIVNTSTIRMRFFLEQCSNQYLRYFLDSDLFKHQMQVQLQGIQPNFGSLHLTKVVIPLPPLAEQKRIVKKVDELMALCDRYEVAKQTRDNLRQKLRGSAIASLMNAETDEELDDAWAFVRDNWHNLSQQPEDADGLRKTVLQLAVRGKLVSQCSEDESASELLNRLGIKPLNSSSEKLLFALPKTWQWLDAELIADVIDPHPSHRTPPEVSDGVPYIGMGDINKQLEINFNDARKVSKEVFKEHTQRYALKLGDFIFGKIGTLGQPVKLTEPFNYTLSANVVLIQPHTKVIHSDYLYSYMTGPVMDKILSSSSRVTTHAAFGIKRMRKLPVPLPPLAEQKRIVAKVDELMKLCDQLEASLRHSQQRAESLAASAISHLTI